MQPKSSLFPLRDPAFGTNAWLCRTKPRAINTTRKAEILVEFIFEFLGKIIKEMTNNEHQVCSTELYTVPFKCQETGVLNTLDIQKTRLMDEDNNEAITRCLLGETCIAVSH